MPENSFVNLVTMNSEGISNWKGSKSFLRRSLKKFVSNPVNIFFFSEFGFVFCFFQLDIIKMSEILLRNNKIREGSTIMF